MEGAGFEVVGLGLGLGFEVGFFFWVSVGSRSVKKLVMESLEKIEGQDFVGWVVVERVGAEVVEDRRRTRTRKGSSCRRSDIVGFFFFGCSAEGIKWIVDGWEVGF